VAEICLLSRPKFVTLEIQVQLSAVGVLQTSDLSIDQAPDFAVALAVLLASTYLPRLRVTRKLAFVLALRLEVGMQARSDLVDPLGLGAV